MSLQREQLMRRIWQTDGVIVRVRGAQLLAIHPNGDRRCKRIGWIETVDALDWLERGILSQTERGYALSRDTLQRLRHGQSPRQVEDARRDRPDPQRPSGRRPPLVAVMAELKDARGRPAYTSAQIEAAKRYARDLHRAGEGRVSTSDVARPKVDGGRSANGTEDAMLLRLDANRAVARAQSGLDGRVVRVLTRVIGADETFEDVDRAQGWGPGVGAMLMQIGLDHLADHYGTRAGR